jgi:acyl dehydratase
MRTRTLKRSPSILPLYARSAVAMLPGASLLPFVPGAGRDIPELELALAGVTVDRDKVAAYSEVCGFSSRDRLPVTYPHVLAFPLHMAIMADGRFPFGAVGLVHIENRIIQRRPIGLQEPLAIRVRPTAIEPHPRGRSFALLTEVLVEEEPVWEGLSRMLRRGAGDAGRPTATPQGAADNGAELPPDGEWRIGGDIGRRYATVSGDRNPIHMHALAAKAFGFPRAIAHGMWTKARCLAALERRLPDAFSAEVSFRKPILLPARVQFLSATEGREIPFAVRGAELHTIHLEGAVRPHDVDTSTRSDER